MAPKSVNPELDAILARPENHACVDCGAKAPRWASVNLGLFFCIDCSGAHRNLGTHITVVKSTTLDKWQPRWIDTVSKIGNRIANEYYENSLRGDQRLKEGDSGQKKANWIRAKYEALEHAPRGKPSPGQLVAQGRNPDVYGNDRSDDDDDHRDRRSTRSEDRREEPQRRRIQNMPREDTRRRDDSRRRRTPSPEERKPNVRQQPPAQTQPTHSPSVDLLNMPTASVSSMASDNWAAFPAGQQQQQPPPQQSSMSFQAQQSQAQQQPQTQYPSSHMLEQLPGPMQAHMCGQMPAQMPPQSMQDQSVNYLQNSLANLYAAPTNTAQPQQEQRRNYSALSSMGGSSVGVPSMGGTFAPNYGGGTGQVQASPFCGGSLRGPAAAGSQSALSTPHPQQMTAQMQMACGMAHATSNISGGMVPSAPSYVAPAMPGNPVATTATASTAPAPSSTPRPTSHSEAMQQVVATLSIQSSTAASSHNSTPVTQSNSSFDIDAFSAFGIPQNGTPQTPAGKTAPSSYTGMQPMGHGAVTSGMPTHGLMPSMQVPGMQMETTGAPVPAIQMPGMQMPGMQIGAWQNMTGMHVPMAQGMCQQGPGAHQMQNMQQMPGMQMGAGGWGYGSGGTANTSYLPSGMGTVAC